MFWSINVVRGDRGRKKSWLATRFCCPAWVRTQIVLIIAFSGAVVQLDSSRNISSSTRRPPLLGSWFEANIPVLSSMLPHITQYDAGPWLSFFIESRLWQFETVPTFVEGTDIHRCDNEYAAHVFRLLADRSPRLKRISYRIINTMNGPLRTPLPIFTYKRSV